ncbi:MAG: F0F1 ATP synthase subunit gamma [Gammaproteobacteria bacterium]|nr:F0F1 ATP synthase subunit gamma [Gammaproteobacteria bacterium]
MAVGKEIRTKIKSVKNTQKITKAMEMVAASKMRKTQQRMQMARPYADKIQAVISHLAHANPDYKHPFLVERPELKRIGYIVVTTDRGLCGGLNANLLRMLLKEIAERQQQGQEIDLCLIGAKGASFFRRFGGNVVAKASHLGDVPHLNDLIGAMKIMLDAYRDGTLDRVFLVHNIFVSSMSQEAKITRVLPTEKIDTDKLQKHWDYIYEPSAMELLDGLLMRYIESQIYRAALENVACEMAARMVAMKSATDNAGDIISRLQLDYNKARQAAITTELSEIVGGAAAIS